jgi:hypothetical protein
MGFALTMRGRWALAAVVAAGVAASWPAVAMARDSLGTFESWAAFRDPETPRCYAIAAPARAGGAGRWRPFAAIGYWPRAGVRGQVHIRLSREIAQNAPIIATVDDSRFTLTGGGADAWATDRRADAAIVAAIRSGTRMSISARSRGGASFSDSYRLRGAATAIDAAALGCGRLR